MTSSAYITLSFCWLAMSERNGIRIRLFLSLSANAICILVVGWLWSWSYWLVSNPQWLVAILPRYLFVTVGNSPLIRWHSAFLPLLCGESQCCAGSLLMSVMSVWLGSLMRPSHCCCGLHLRALSFPSCLENSFLMENTTPWCDILKAYSPAVHIGNAVTSFATGINFLHTLSCALYLVTVSHVSVHLPFNHPSILYWPDLVSFWYLLLFFYLRSENCIPHSFTKSLIQ